MWRATPPHTRQKSRSRGGKGVVGGFLARTEEAPKKKFRTKICVSEKLEGTISQNFDIMSPSRDVVPNTK